MSKFIPLSLSIKSAEPRDISFEDTDNEKTANG